jgi:hypothetical protein
MRLMRSYQDRVNLETGIECALQHRLLTEILLMRLIMPLSLLALTLSGAASAEGIQMCSASQSEQVGFIQARVEPMPAKEALRPSEQWVMTVRNDPEGSAASLADYCKAHPYVPLALAFRDMLDSD